MSECVRHTRSSLSVSSQRWPARIARISLRRSSLGSRVAVVGVLSSTIGVTVVVWRETEPPRHHHQKQHGKMSNSIIFPLRFDLICAHCFLTNADRGMHCAMMILFIIWRRLDGYMHAGNAIGQPSYILPEQKSDIYFLLVFGVITRVIVYDVRQVSCCIAILHWFLAEFFLGLVLLVSQRNNIQLSVGIVHPMCSDCVLHIGFEYFPYGIR